MVQLQESRLKFSMPRQVQTLALVLIVIGIITTLAQIWVPDGLHHAAEGAEHAAEHHGNPRLFLSIHLGLLFAIPLALGGVFFAAFNHLSGAAWSVTVRRVAESTFWFLPVVLLLSGLVFLGSGDVFHHWVHAEGDHLIEHKSAWLNVPRFVVMNIVVIAIWFVFGFLFWKNSVDQDKDGNPAHSKLMAKLGAGFLVVFGLSYSANSWDMSMALEPHWFSTLWALYIFAGLALVLYASLILWTWFLKRQGLLGDAVNENHWHDLGKYMWGHTIFWAYMAISQYMLIWYGHLPEETIFYATRTNDTGWYIVTVLVPVLRFVLPFFLIIKREWKRNLNYLAGISVLVLVGQIVDMYWIAYPTLAGGDFVWFSWRELGAIAFVVGAYILVVGKALERNALIPKKDPRLEECLHFHQ
ncbi:MAG: hypothetical protein H7A21_03485 [Spirochaetales bacterium]|nr:hypothetical protein [Leptospiraceae bacterium]MCP5480472.1 hypothetical protein [Spirochaetales bacterium]